MKAYCSFLVSRENILHGSLCGSVHLQMISQRSSYSSEICELGSLLNFRIKELQHSVVCPNFFVIAWRSLWDVVEGASSTGVIDEELKTYLIQKHSITPVLYCLLEPQVGPLSPAPSLFLTQLLCFLTKYLVHY